MDIPAEGKKFVKALSDIELKSAMVFAGDIVQVELGQEYEDFISVVIYALDGTEIGEKDIPRRLIAQRFEDV